MKQRIKPISFSESEIESETWVHILSSRKGKKVLISNLGRLRYLDKNKDIITLGSFDVKGYLRIKVSSKEYKVHRLVASAFLGMDLSNQNLQVNHINMIKNDNRVSNLEVVTPKENVAHYRANNTNRKYYSSTNGVSFHKCCKRFCVKGIGCIFKTEEEAVTALHQLNEGTYIHLSAEERYFRANQDRILDSLFLYKQGFMFKQIRHLTKTFSTTIKSWEKSYSHLLPEDYTPVTFDYSTVVKWPKFKTGKENIYRIKNPRLGRKFYNKKGEFAYEIINENQDDTCNIKFTCGTIMENVKYSQLRKGNLTTKSQIHK